jgi:hypothetical protein
MVHAVHAIIVWSAILHIVDFYTQFRCERIEVTNNIPFRSATKNAVAFTSRPFFTCHLVVLPLGAHMSNLGRTLMMPTSYYVRYLFPNNGIICIKLYGTVWAPPRKVKYFPPRRLNWFVISVELYVLSGSHAQKGSNCALCTKNFLCWGNTRGFGKESTIVNCKKSVEYNVIKRSHTAQMLHFWYQILCALLLAKISFVTFTQLLI